MASATERKVVFPGSAKPIGPYSPGIFAGDYLYVSGQGARDVRDTLPDTVEAQTRQCLDNIKTIVEAAGLTMDHVVYTHTYLADMASYAPMNKAYASYFSVLPARSTMGVARMPTGTPVEISAIAVRDLSTRKVVTLPNAQSPVPISPGILTDDRFFISGILGRDAEKGITPESGTEQIRMCLSRLDRVLQAAGVAGANMVHLNVYRTGGLPAEELEKAMRHAYPETALSLLEVAALPFGVKVGVTGVAVRDVKSKRVYKVDGKTECASAGVTVYCAARGAGPEADAVSEAAAKIDSGLKALGTNLSRAVANNVYLGNMDDFTKMNGAYGRSFPTPPPTRTTVQPIAGGPAVVLSVVAVR